MPFRDRPPKITKESDPLLYELLNPRPDEPEATPRGVSHHENMGEHVGLPHWNNRVEKYLTMLRAVVRKNDSRTATRVANMVYDTIMLNEDESLGPNPYFVDALTTAITHGLGEDKVKRAGLAAVHSLLLHLCVFDGMDANSRRAYTLMELEDIRDIKEKAGLTHEEMQKVGMPVYDKRVGQGQNRAALNVAIAIGLSGMYVEDPAENSITGYLQRGDHIGAADVAVEAGFAKGRVEQMLLHGYDIYLSNAVVHARLAREAEVIHAARAPLGNLSAERQKELQGRMDYHNQLLVKQLRNAATIAGRGLGDDVILHINKMLSRASSHDYSIIIDTAFRI